MNAVIYARFSSHAQNEQSIEGQLAECYAFAQKNDYTIVGEYIDRALTGMNDKRGEFQRMIADSEKKGFQYVIVYQLDRFARNRYDSATYKARLKKNGVRVLSARENITDDASGILIEGVLESMAEYYSAELSQKVRRGMKINAEKHLSNGCQPPFGFYVDAEKHFQVDEKLRGVVEDIFRQYADGKTCAEICDYLNERHYNSQKGKPFGKNSLQHLLRNKKYIGTYIYKDIEAPNAIPRIISDELFERVQERLKGNRLAPSRVRASEEYLLTGKLFCGECGAMMIGISGTGKSGAIYRYYSCNGVKRQKCKKRNAKKASIESCVAQSAARQLTPENIDLIAKNISIVLKEESKQSELNHLQEQIKALAKEQENLMAALRSSGAVESVAKIILADLQKVAEQRAQLESLAAIEQYRNLRVSEPEIKFFLSRLMNHAADNLQYRKMLINIFVNRVYLHDNGKVTIHFNIKDGKEELTYENIAGAEEYFQKGSSVESNAPPYKKPAQMPVFRRLCGFSFGLDCFLTGA